ncbi:hypothetical protein [Novosphingobium sp. SCN 63-17]|uniref:hypothetical protein n=1 Tax=Novosphingobium sp. SCN 63-17 TaxID=1660120 RepID=UPI00086E0F6C|nr:hypothetical protein [Novosphingobium sp. SCN 63-17]ODU81648.1 MAG: hypothetical protein ABT10_13495 [Novosphingobium sp. SCN 63-17]
MSEIDIEAVRKAMLRLDHVCNHGTGEDVVLVARALDQLAKENDRLTKERDEAVSRLGDMNIWVAKVQMEAQDLHERSKARVAAMQNAIVEADRALELGQYGTSYAVVKIKAARAHLHPHLPTPEPEPVDPLVEYLTHTEGYFPRVAIEVAERLRTRFEVRKIGEKADG